ncbi:MAG TPA: hypothetical protein VFW85_05975 [Gaiellaceae bacterium]|nr:hypothetical protein [Gaiellaceae bacterium]
MHPDVRAVPISLRDDENNLFLPEHQVTFHGEAPGPVDHAGRRYVFTHTVEGGYAGGATIYVFRAV